jgi:hypothetical protein
MKTANQFCGIPASSISLFLILSASLTLTGCGSSTETSSGNSPQPQPGSAPVATAPGTPLPSPSSPSQSSCPTFQFFSVIREFGGKDNNALFGILPDQGANLGVAKISKVVEFGADFLNGYRAGTLDQQTMTHLFLNSTVPMSQQEKESLVSKYNGAQIIYFGGYQGQLCTDEEFKIEVNSTFGDFQLSTTFDVRAEPSSTGDCSFHVFSAMTQDQC